MTNKKQTTEGKGIKDFEDLIIDFYEYCQTYPTPRELKNAIKKVWNWVQQNQERKIELVFNKINDEVIGGDEIDDWEISGNYKKVETVRNRLKSLQRQKLQLLIKSISESK